MFKRTALAFSLLALSSIAAAQQPMFWPWMPVQVWAVPADGQAVPFPTPFWLWVVPPGTAPAAATPADPVVVAPKAAEAAPAPAQVTAPVAVPTVPTVTPAVTPLPVATPAPEVAKPAAPVEQADSQSVATPLPPAASVSPAAIPATPISVEVAPAPIRRAPVTKKITKPATAAPARPVRKLCFKGGKLDVCP